MSKDVRRFIMKKHVTLRIVVEHTICRIKLHISVDEESKKIVSFRITKGNVHDTKKFGQLVKEAAKKYDIDKVYGDKAYDNRKNFSILDDINAEPAISIRKNASTRSKGCPLRRDGSFAYQETRI